VFDICQLPAIQSSLRDGFEFDGTFPALKGRAKLIGRYATDLKLAFGSMQKFC